MRALVGASQVMLAVFVSFQGCGKAMRERWSGRPTSGPSVGQLAPDIQGEDTSGVAFKLSDFRGKVVVLEWFNQDCPFVKLNHTKGPLKDMAKKKMEQGIVWLSINSGAPGKQGHGVVRNRDGQRTYAMTNPILLDETGEVGRAYGAKTTPHVFVVDRQGTLVYAGAIDNAQDGEPPGGEAFTNYVENALADIAAVRTRWQHAASPTPPQRRRPTVTTRASPPTTTATHTARSTQATR